MPPKATVSETREEEKKPAEKPAEAKAPPKSGQREPMWKPWLFTGRAKKD